MGFLKAVKHDAKLRMSIAGPSGAGKTFTALTLATALADGQPVALIDTERGSASKYADVFSFDVMELDNFHPNNFVAGIHDAEQGGYAVLVIDSLTHAWNGTGGLLDIVDSIAKRKYSNNTFAAWKDATPIQNALIDAITASPLHIIVTMRSKQEYALEVGANGKSSPKKVGMAPIQRDGMEYEFDVVVDMDIDNTMIVQKSRCSALSSAVIPKPDKKVIAVLKPWLSGVPRLETTNRGTDTTTKPATSTPTPAHTQETVQPAQSKKAAPVFTKLDDATLIPQLKAQAEGLKMIWDAVLKTSCGKRYEVVVQAGDDATPEDCAIIAAFLNKVAQARAKQNGGDKLPKAS